MWAEARMSPSKGSLVRRKESDSPRRKRRKGWSFKKSWEMGEGPLQLGGLQPAVGDQQRTDLFFFYERKQIA